MSVHLKSIQVYITIIFMSQVVIFPEGTDLTDGSRKRSHQYADSHGLPQYKHVLHPKTTGFTFITQRMRKSMHLLEKYFLS